VRRLAVGGVEDPLGGQVLDALDRHLVGRVAHQDVDAAELGDRTLDQLPAVGLLRTSPAAVTHRRPASRTTRAVSFASSSSSAGAGVSNEPSDQGFMYSRSFADPDGHLFDVLWMDPSNPRADAAERARTRRPPIGSAVRLPAKALGTTSATGLVRAAVRRAAH
jgi:hypothetical protein